MTEGLALMPYFAGGIGLSAVSLASLWWTVRRVASRKAATHWLVSGFFVRALGVSACCVFTGRIAGWAALAAVMAGLIVGRAVLLRCAGRPAPVEEASS